MYNNLNLKFFSLLSFAGFSRAIYILHWLCPLEFIVEKWQYTLRVGKLPLPRSAIDIDRLKLFRTNVDYSPFCQSFRVLISRSLRANREFNFHLNSSSVVQTRRDYSPINLLFSCRPSSSLPLLPPIVAVAAEMSRKLRFGRRHYVSRCSCGNLQQLRFYVRKFRRPS